MAKKKTNKLQKVKITFVAYAHDSEHALGYSWLCKIGNVQIGPSEPYSSELKARFGVASFFKSHLPSKTPVFEKGT